MILKKSAEYVNYAKKANQELKSENERLRDDFEKLKQEKDQLREEKQSIQTELKNSRLVTVEIVDLDFTYIYVDSMWEIVTGYEMSEITGKSSRDVIACATCPMLLKHTEDVMEGLKEGKEWQGVVLGARKDGKLFACEAVTSPVKNKSGTITQFITKRKNFHILTAAQADKVCQHPSSLESGVEFLSNLRISSIVESEI